MKNTLLLLFVIWQFLPLIAQENIVVETNNTQFILKITYKKDVKMEYYGKRMQSIDDLFNAKANTSAEAYPAFGVRPDKAIAIRAKHANDDLTLVLKYQSHEQTKVDKNVTITTIHLKDEIYPFYVDIKYKTFAAEDVIETWTEISHSEKKSVTLYNYASSYLAFNAPTAYISHFHGNWGTEFTMEEIKLERGTFSIESKEGIRSSTKDNASFFLGLNNPLSENKGDVVAGALAWTGNFDISFEHNEYSQISVTAGINNYGSEYTLDKNKKFITPALILTYSNEGKGQASRNLHHYARKYKMIGGNEERKILLNSWEGVYMKFNEDKIVALIDDIASIGGELFVLDDGWFGNKYARNKADQGLGDWQVCKEKLPNGIEKLIDESENRGIKFGIWVEPEMANTKSELYENHPEWVLQNTDRELVKGRGKTQVVLDLSNPEVQDFVFDMVNDLLTKNPRIDYIKWDANATLTNYGSTYLPKDRQSNLYIDYHLGLQSVLQRLRANHPDIIMQACASGGGRTNYGFLQYFSEFWPSDNTDALQRIYIQWGMSHVFPAITIASHVSASPNHQTHREIPLKFRFDVAMTGRLGLELQPKNMTEKEKEFSKAAIAVYKDIRTLVQFGDLYRIISPFEHDRMASLMYVDEQKDNAVFFAYYLEKQSREVLPYFKFRGLKPNARYTINEINKLDDREVFSGNGKTYSGSFLMNSGIKLDLSKEYDSVVLQIKVKQE